MGAALGADHPYVEEIAAALDQLDGSEGAGGVAGDAGPGATADGPDNVDVMA